MKRALRYLLPVVCAGLAALAGPCAAAPSWKELSPEQRQALHGLEMNWDELPAERRDHLVEGTDRWLKMSPEEQNKAKGRLQRWNNLDPDRKERMRRLREEYRSMSPEQRSELRDRYKAFKDLPEDERDRIRERFKELRARPGGLEAECGLGSLDKKLDCLGLPAAGGEAPRDEDRQ